MHGEGAHVQLMHSLDAKGGIELGIKGGIEKARLTMRGGVGGTTHWPRVPVGDEKKMAALSDHRDFDVMESWEPPTTHAPQCAGRALRIQWVLFRGSLLQAVDAALTELPPPANAEGIGRVCVRACQCQCVTVFFFCAFFAFYGRIIVLFINQLFQ